MFIGEYPLRFFENNGDLYLKQLTEFRNDNLPRPHQDAPIKTRLRPPRPIRNVKKVGMRQKMARIYWQSRYRLKKNLAQPYLPHLKRNLNI